MRSRSLVFAMASSLTVAAAAGAQAGRTVPSPKYTKVIELDSVEIATPAISPDGKWIVYSGGPTYSDARNLWLVSSSGGKPIRLTSGEYDDRNPSWYSSGDRLLFKTTRIGNGCMMMGIDPAGGRVTEPPRRLTMEPAFGCRLSPDAKWIAYVSNSQMHGDTRPGVLRIMPATGGTPRTLDSTETIGDGFFVGAFTHDHRYLEYVTAPAKAPQEVRRVAIGGGASTLVRRASAETARSAVPNSIILPGEEGVIAHYRADSPDTLYLENLTGDTLSQIAVKGLRRAQYQTAKFSSSANGTPIVSEGTPYEIRVVSTDGGRSRVLRNASIDDYFNNVLSDGRVAIDTRVGGRRALDIVRLNGGPAERIMFPDAAATGTITRDGKAIYWQNSQNGRSEGGVYDIASKTTRIISNHLRFFSGEWLLAQGSRDDMLYVDRTDTNVEFRLWSPVTNSSRLVRSLPRDLRLYDMAAAARGSVVAYTLGEGDSAITYLAPSPASVPQRILAVRGTHVDGMAISPDGRHLAIGAQIINGTDTTHAVAFLDLLADGTPAGKPRLTNVGNMNLLHWLPSSTEIVYTALEKNGNCKIMRLSSVEGATPRLLADDQKPVWDFAPSSDGKWVAYAAELPTRSVLWRVETARGPAGAQKK